MYQNVLFCSKLNHNHLHNHLHIFRSCFDKESSKKSFWDRLDILITLPQI